MDERQDVSRLGLYTPVSQGMLDSQARPIKPQQPGMVQMTDEMPMRHPIGLAFAYLKGSISFVQGALVVEGVQSMYASRMQLHRALHLFRGAVRENGFVDRLLDKRAESLVREAEWLLAEVTRQLQLRVRAIERQEPSMQMTLPNLDKENLKLTLQTPMLGDTDDH